MRFRDAEIFNCFIILDKKLIASITKALTQSEQTHEGQEICLCLFCWYLQIKQVSSRLLPSTKEFFCTCHPQTVVSMPRWQMKCLAEATLLGWGQLQRQLRWLPVQAWGSEFRFPTTYVKAKHSQRTKDGILGACCWASLAKTVGFMFSERSCIKETVQRMVQQGS